MPSIVDVSQMDRQMGFTLIELMVALVIAVILLSIGVPGLRQFIQNSRIISQTNELVADLKFARSEAIKRGVNVAICMGTPSGCGGVTNWHAGRTVFVDANNSNSWNSGEQILRIRETLEGGNTLVFTGGSLVAFARTGMIAAGSGIFRLCDARGESSRREVEITGTGIVKAAASQGTCS